MRACHERPRYQQAIEICIDYFQTNVLVKLVKMQYRFTMFVLLVSKHRLLTDLLLRHPKEWLTLSQIHIYIPSGLLSCKYEKLLILLK